MACEKCRQIGQETKIYRYAAEDGRWRKIETCKHKTRRVWLETDITRKPCPGPRRVYTREQDVFILLHYKAGHDHKQHGTQQMLKMAKAFQSRFHTHTTTNMLIGRYHRIKDYADELLADVRATPSLPALKFMEDRHV
jgi:hypothetical protein